jgi:hypothetical protein
VIAARADFAKAFRFSETPSDVLFARRDWVFLPEGEIAAIDRVVTGSPALKTYLRFRTPAHLAFAADRRLASGTVGQSGIAIHAVALSGGTPSARSLAISDCERGPFGACKGTRAPVDEYAVDLPGPAALAVHVIDGLRKDEAPAQVSPLGEGILGASILRGGRRTLVIATKAAEAGPGAAMTYAAPGDRTARHVVFDAPEGESGRAMVRADVKDGHCQIDIKPAPPGSGFAGRPLVFTTAPISGSCAVAEDLDAPPGAIR